MRSKIITLAEELRRRMLNIDGFHRWEDQKEVYADYIQKLCDSGYEHTTRLEIIKSTVKKF